MDKNLLAGYLRKVLPEKIYEQIRKIYWMLSYIVFSVLRKSRGDESLVVCIDPMLINRTVASNDPTLVGNSLGHIGRRQNGDWDISGHLVDKYCGVFDILKQRLELGLEYDQIPDFLNHLEKIRRDGSFYHCRSSDEYKNKWLKTEALYWDIKKNGYMAQSQLGNVSVDEIRVQIGRDGEILFEEGLHRLAIARLLSLKAVPVIITRRHQKWSDLRNDIIKVIAARGYIHQPFNHPDLDILPKLYGRKLKDQALYGNDRWDFIAENLSYDKGTVLDIGAYFGYFAHCFEERGFDVYAVELNRNYLAILKRYQEIRHKKFVVWEKSLFDIDKFDYDIVIALNVFHHLIKQKEEHEKLAAFLQKLKLQAMFFEPHKNMESYAYKSYSDAEFIDFIINNSMLNHSRLLGRAKEGRNVYLLTV